jgi:hypothetical protein
MEILNFSKNIKSFVLALFTNIIEQLSFNQVSLSKRCTFAGSASNFLNFLCALLREEA